MPPRLKSSLIDPLKTPVNILFFFLLYLPAFAQVEVYNLKLHSVDDQVVSTSEWKNQPFTVLVFLLADCPACQSYSKTLNELSSKYHSRNVRFAGIFPGQYGTREEMIEFRRRYKINFGLYRDPDKQLVRLTAASVAPQVILIDRKGNQLYSGRIDDWMYALGKKRMKVTNRDLDNALAAVTEGRQPAVTKTVPIGCIIE